MRFSLIKFIGGPGSPGFFLVVAAVGLLLHFASRRTKRIGRFTLTALVLLYVLMSLPVVAEGIVRLAGGWPPQPLVNPERVDNVFVLDGDNYRGRGLAAGQLHAATAPELFWVIGGGELKDAMEAAGVPANHWIWGGVPDRSTIGQMLHVKERMTSIKMGRAAVIVSRLQAPRVSGIVRRERMNVVVIGAPVDREPAASGVRRWLPSVAALAVSRDALYEWAALAYYRRQGWI
jgi:hypothetical protein